MFFEWFCKIHTLNNYGFLELYARVSPKVTTNGSFRGKQISKISFSEAIILKQRRRSVTEEIYLFMLILECLCLEQLQIFWKRLHAFHSKYPPKGILEVKTLRKFRFLGCFSKEKTKECDQKVWNVFDEFWSLYLVHLNIFWK